METETHLEELNTSLSVFSEALYKPVKLIEEVEVSTLGIVEEEGIPVWRVSANASEILSHIIDSNLKGAFTLSNVSWVAFGSDSLVMSFSEALQPFRDFFISFQENSILVPDHKNIVEYLKEFTDLTQVIQLAGEKTREEFAIPDQLSLEMFLDPESDDKYPTLYVRQEIYDEDIMDRIEKVSETFESLLGRSEGWFLITTDFANSK